MSDETLTRRERQRRATMEEIVTTAREQLSEPGGLSLRAIAQEMGMTPPALYRYVASAEELTLTVAASVYDDLVDEMREATTRHADAGPETQIIAAAIAYRKWALGHRDEFELCFVQDTAAPGDDQHNACAVAGDRFRRFFADLFIEIYRRDPFDVPAEEQMPDIEALLTDEMNPFVDEYREWSAEDVPAGVQWLFLQMWTRLFGIVALEAFGHIAPMIIESGALFGTVVRDCAQTLGIDADAPEIQAAVADELAR